MEHTGRGWGKVFNNLSELLQSNIAAPVGRATMDWDDVLEVGIGIGHYGGKLPLHIWLEQRFTYFISCQYGLIAWGHMPIEWPSFKLEELMVIDLLKLSDGQKRISPWIIQIFQRTHPKIYFVIETWNRVQPCCQHRSQQSQNFQKF